MAESTKIQWTGTPKPDGTMSDGATLNPWRGCQRVSPGCQNCYAESLSGRNPGVLGVWGPDGTRVVASEAMWKEPAKWDRAARKAGVRKKVFCASLADVFEAWEGPMVDSHEERLWTTTMNSPASWLTKPNGVEVRTPTRPLTMDDVRLRLMGVIRETPGLDWLILTKRPENVVPTLERLLRLVETTAEGLRPDDPLTLTYSWLHKWRTGTPPANVWLGTSVEDQARADERIPHLLGVPAVVRFLSCEPLLGPIDLSRWSGRDGLHWSIIGGESGHHARPCDREWVASLVRQCGAANMAVFVKQLGAAYSDEANGVAGKSLLIPAEALGLLSRRLADPKGGSVGEWPESLRVRQFPEATS